MSCQTFLNQVSSRRNVSVLKYSMDKKLMSICRLDRGNKMYGAFCYRGPNDPKETYFRNSIVWRVTHLLFPNIHPLIAWIYMS